MRTSTQRTELAANIAIIVVSVVTGIMLVRHYLDSRHSVNRVTPQRQLPVGMQISLPDVDWAANHRTLVLALSSKCRYCTESKAFYQRLAQEAVGPGSARLVAVFPEDKADGEKYLKDLGVDVSQVSKTSLSSINITGTPTLLLINDKGIVTDAWGGRLPANKESEVLHKVQSSASH